jgi:hypothetical protein
MLMVPIYGISSLIALFSLEAAFVIDAIRDIYEVRENYSSTVDRMLCLVALTLVGTSSYRYIEVPREALRCEHPRILLSVTQTLTIYMVSSNLNEC